jgi:hypothetical protein
MPAELRAMKPAEREQVIEEKAKARSELQTKIQSLNAEREKFVKAEMKKQAETGPKTMDAALIESARSQGGKQAFSFE